MKTPLLTGTIGQILLVALAAIAPSLMACQSDTCGPEPVVPSECVVVSRGECPGQDVWFCHRDGVDRCFTTRGTVETSCPTALDAGATPDAGVGADGSSADLDGSAGDAR
jgi:hypothetical protein